MAVGFVAAALATPLVAEEPLNYVFIPGEMYRTPTHFGPATGPRRGPDGVRFDNRDSPKATSYSISFVTQAEKLQRLLPSGFALRGEPVVSKLAQHPGCGKPRGNI